MENKIISMSSPYPDGQRVTGAAVKYEKNLSAQRLAADSFSVEGRNIISVYTNSKAEFASEPAEGSYVIIELDPKDGAASTLTNKEGIPISMPREPRKPGGPRPPMGGPREEVLPDGRVFAGPSGLMTLRNKVEISVRQNSNLQAADGSIIPAWESARVNDEEYNEWSDLFKVRKFEDIEYNIYIPENYDPAKKYPMLMFIHDAGTTGNCARVTLEQGIGATVFASPEEQKKHPCIVVAPQHEKHYPIANDRYWCFDDEHTYKRLLDSLQKEFSVDEDRVYITGQSMGFMTSIQLMLDYPGYFAAALLPAGHWDIEKTATLWDQNVWMFLSEEDKGGMRLVEGLPKAIEASGGRLGIYRWDADQPTETISEMVKNTKDDGFSFHLTIFTDDSIKRKNQVDRTDGGGHNGTWHFVYQIEGARDWLFEQHR